MRPIDNSADWYVEVDGERLGPLRWSALVELLKLRGARSSDRIWRPGLPEWIAADEFDLATQARIQRTLGSRLAIGMWFVATVIYVAETSRSWMDVADGRLAAQVQSLGAIALPIIGFILLRRFWRITEPKESSRLGALAGLTRALMSVSYFVLVALALSLAVNARDLFRIAFGADPMQRGEVRLLAGEREIEVRGPLNAGIAQDFRELLDSHPGIAVVHLNSPGGWVREGTVIASLIEEHGLATYSATGCASACIIPFSAGVQRTLAPEARLGFHTMSGRGTDPFFISWLNEKLATRLRNLGASKEFVTEALSAPATSLWRPAPELLVQNGIVTSVSSDGFSASGEPLREYDAEVTAVHDTYRFIARLQEYDPVRFASFERSLRLSLNRGASQYERTRLVVALANDLELERLPRIDDPSAARYVSFLREAAQQEREVDDLQCVGILGRGVEDLALREEPAVSALDPGLSYLVTAQTGEDATTSSQARDALLRVMQHANLADPASVWALENPNDRSPAELCDALLWLYAMAMAEGYETTADFVRATRIE